MRVLFAALIVSLLSLVTAGITSAAVKMESGESFAEPTTREILLTVLALRGLDVNAPGTLADYARIFYCDIYKEKFKNDFEWNQVQRQLLARINSPSEYYRLNYQISGVVLLGRYDFKKQEFPFEEESALNNVGSLTMLAKPDDGKGFCGESLGLSVPRMATIVFSQPLTYESLKMPMDKAQELLDRFVQMKNERRMLHLRFRVRVTGFDNMFFDASRGWNQKATFKGDLVGMDLFLDREMTQQVASVPLK